MSRTYTPRSPTYKVFLLDTGTTGLSPESCSLSSLAVLEHDSPTKSSPPSHFSTYIRPSHLPPHPFIPPFRTVVPALRAFIQAATPHGQTPLLVAHNAPFDAAFLHTHLTHANLSLPSDWRFACSYALARSLLPSDPSSSVSQSALAARFHVTVHAEHHAHDDVRVLREVLHRLCSQHKDRRSLASHLAAYATSLATCAARYDTPSPAVALAFFVEGGDAPCHTERYCDILLNELGPAGTVDSCPLPDAAAWPKCHRCTHVPALLAPAEDPAAKLRDLVEAAPTRRRSAKGKYIITKTGSKFHVSPTCYGLRKAKSLSYVICPPDKREPCGLCARGAARGRDALAPAETAAGGNDEDEDEEDEEEEEEEEEEDSSSQEFIITQTGRLFHADRDCYNLRSAIQKIPVTDVPARLDPCRRCTDGKRPVARPTRIRKEEKKEEAEERKQVGKKLVSSETSPALKACERMFFKTNWGKKVHVDRNCRHLQDREVVVCDPVVEEKEPCRTCSLDLFQELEVSQWCHFCEDMTHIGSLHEVVSGAGAGAFESDEDYAAFAKLCNLIAC